MFNIQNKTIRFQTESSLTFQYVRHNGHQVQILDFPSNFWFHDMLAPASYKTAQNIKHGIKFLTFSKRHQNCRRKCTKTLPLPTPHQKWRFENFLRDGASEGFLQNLSNRRVPVKPWDRQKLSSVRALLAGLGSFMKVVISECIFSNLTQICSKINLGVYSIMSRNPPTISATAKTLTHDRNF